MTKEFITDTDLNDYEHQQDYMLSVEDSFEPSQKARIRDENRDLWDKSWPKSSNNHD
jgi:hypothetical protein